MAGLKVVAEAKPTGLERLVDDYFMACRAKGLSLNTLETSYGYPLHHVFLPWCRDQGISDVAALDTRTINAFAVFLRETPGKRGSLLAPTSVHAYTRAVRGFLNWCAREGESVAAKPPLPKLSRRVVDVLDRDEIRRLIASAPTERDRLILSILADCGPRNEEVCTLTVGAAVQRDRRAFLKVHEKGGGEREVPLPPALFRALERYEANLRPRDAKTDRLFLGLRRGLSGEYEPLGRSGVLQLVKSAAARAGIKKNVYPHLLRHSFATNALKGGMNPMLVATILGHHSMRMIERVYSHLNSGDAYDALLELLRQG